MHIKISKEELNKFPLDIYSENLILIKAKEYNYNNVSYKEDELIVKTDATIEQLSTDTIIYEIVTEVPIGFKQLVFPTSEKEYYTIAEIEGE